jgi:hypothetical protein
MDISRYDLTQVVRILWNNSKPASFFQSSLAIASNTTPPTELSDEEIQKALNNEYEKGYIDYLNGRIIKTRFSNTKKVDFQLYNYNYGTRKAEELISSLPRIE